MSPSTLSIVKKSLEENLKIDEKRKERLLDIIKLWKKDQIIYPNLIKSQLLISFNEAYNILDILENQGILKYAFQVYCHKCDKFQEIPIMDSLNEFPKNLYCDEDHQLDPLTDTILLYKVVCNE